MSNLVYGIEIIGFMLIGGVGMGGITGSSPIALQASVEERDVGKNDIHSSFPLRTDNS